MGSLSVHASCTVRPSTNPRRVAEGIGKGVHTLVLQMVRLQTGTQKGNADHIILDVMSVFAVIQKADAVISLGEVSKTMGNALKSG